MTAQSHFAAVEDAFAGLLQSLTGAWPVAGLDYVREELGHGEYGEALQNLIALGQRNGVGFMADQVAAINHLASLMEIEDSPFVVQVREAA